jgi:non-ribosomal peptide synthase protein (TIGR01720 family)
VEHSTPLSCRLSRVGTSLGQLRYVTACLSSEETDMLVRVLPRTQGVQITDILLTALALGVRQWTGDQPLVVSLSGHGRETPFDDLDVSRTVGWFATEFPVLIDLGTTTNPHRALTLVTEQLHQVPDGGLGYGLLRYMSRDDTVAARLRGLPAVDIGLNYQGRPEHLFEESGLLAIRKKTNTQPPSDAVPISYRLPVSSQIHGGQLYLRIRFHTEAYQEKDVHAILDDVVASLRALVRTSPVATG